MAEQTSLVRVPTSIRDHAHRLAGPGQTLGDVFAAGIAALEKELFWERIAVTAPDEDYLREFAEWDQAPLGAVSE